MSNTFLISLIIPIKIILIYLIVSYFRKKKIKEKEQTSEAIERMQIREYGKKINDETRSKRLK
jgi:hypothetical protein